MRTLNSILSHPSIGKDTKVSVISDITGFKRSYKDISEPVVTDSQDSGKVTLPPPSDEQREIINRYVAGDNVRVIAGAGCAKTTTLLQVCKELPSSEKVLILTYNRRLKDELRVKTNSLGLDNVTGHNFHSFMLSYTGKQGCCRDGEIIRYFNKLDVSSCRKLDYTHLMVDECQDITPLYFKIVQLIMSVSPLKQIMIVGDPNQNIFDFMDATSKYLLEPEGEHAFGREFHTCYLRTTYRLSQNMVNFVNHHFIGDEILKCGSGRSGPKVEMVYYHPFNSTELVSDIVKENINIYGVDQIYILAHSTKARNPRTPLRMLVEELNMNGIKVYTSDDDAEDLDERNQKGKIVLSTYHKVKGSERSCVILFGFESFYDSISKGKKFVERPNPMYVALTRAIHKMVIISSDIFRTVDIDKLSIDSDVYMHNQLLTDRKAKEKFKESAEKIVKRDCSHKKSIKCGIKELTRHLPSQFSEDLNEQLDKKLIRYQSVRSSTEFNIEFDGTNENVSAIYGTSVVLYYEWKRDRRLVYVEDIIDNFEKVRNHYGDGEMPLMVTMMEAYKSLQKGTSNVYQIICKIGNCINCLGDYHSSYYQVANYDWVDGKYIEDCSSQLVDTLEYLKVEDSEFEYPVHQGFRAICDECQENCVLHLDGRLDIETKKFSVEIKTKSMLDEEDFLQAGLYSSVTGKMCYLANIRTGEIYSVRSRCLDVCSLLERKYGVSVTEKMGWSKELVDIEIYDFICDDEESEPSDGLEDKCLI